MTDSTPATADGWHVPTEAEDRAVVSGMFHRFARPDDPTSTYVVSHTGLVVEVSEPAPPGEFHRQKTKWVVSMVNGSMAHNGLNQMVDCVNFDWYIMDWFALENQTHKVVGIAYFNPATMAYEEVPGQEMPEYPSRVAANLDPDPETWNSGV